MTRTPRHKNIPFFIPHCGCGHNCVFCSQRKITGYYLPQGEMLREAARLEETVDEALSCANNAELQIAFFGGTFTGIERERMLLLLETAFRYVRDGRVSGIRLSTRPDRIDTETLEILKRFGVTDIELGVQSTDEAVLKASGRGHGAAVCFESAALILKYGFSLGGQMMTGLPGSALQSELRTAEDIVKMGARSARIYPAVVFEGTPLYDMVQNGSYTPLTVEDAVFRTAECLKVFEKAGVEMLRIGLHSSPELAAAPFGANHPAIGELVYSKVAYDEIRALIGEADTAGKTLLLSVPKRRVSAAAGHGGCNKKLLYKNYGFAKIKISIGEGDKIKANIKA